MAVRVATFIALTVVCLAATTTGECPDITYDALYDFNNPSNDITDSSVTMVGSFTGSGCSKRGVLKLALAASGSRRRVLIDLFFTNPSNWVFNLGDSSTNNGYGGDTSTQSRDAEVQGVGKTLQGYLSDPGNTANVLNIADLYNTRLTLIAGDEHLVWLSDDNNNFNYYSNENFYALNGQSDTQGSVNYDLYLGLNKVISGSSRTGSGLCKVGIKFLPEF